jgi:predicted DCC family thiol-disulfide oxidoreductase YuxK
MQHSHPTTRATSPAAGWPQRLTVIYDDRCELCIRCSRWLAVQQTHVEMRFLPSSDPAVYDRYGDLPWFRIELMVVTDDGVAWVGSSAFIMCLWATLRYNRTSYRLSGRTLAPVAERFFHMVSSNRSMVSGLLAPTRCDNGSCSHQPGYPTPPSVGVTRP